MVFICDLKFETYWMGSVGDLHGYLGSVSKPEYIVFNTIIMYKYSGLVVVHATV